MNIFQISNPTTIYHRACQMTPRHNIVRRKIKNMLGGSISTPPSSVSSFSFIIITEDDGRARFFVDYRIRNLKWRRIASKLPKIEESFEDLRFISICSRDTGNRYGWGIRGNGHFLHTLWYLQFLYDGIWANERAFHISVYDLLRIESHSLRPGLFRWCSNPK